MSGTQISPPTNSLRVRFTVRGMMAAVAVVALPIGVDRLIRRSHHYRKMADLYAQLETRSRENQTNSHEKRQAACGEGAARSKDGVPSMMNNIAPR